ncbi:NADH-dependent flavin oxidoreductase [Salimicrobium flavidum]|uniref:2,4-dienoyl-CoA reductase n=1 Tax=Salimicrobium flavidum TaxID=570947 RepID=A0A1N7JI89_9BACI|nr:NADH-dependent flavin oxidoreductase [Salimicrobium flavidum]SIS49039.1 2,4-dienoyl-CoA reductase [Salimicrobium flavidum]
MFDSYTLPSGVTMKNRLLLAPMTNFLSEDDGQVSEKELQYYRRRSRGLGAVITACANVNAQGKGFDGEIGVDRDELIPGLKQLADVIHDEGAKAILQIYHGGRMCPPHLLPDETPVSASAVPPEREGAATPREMTSEEITRTIEDFKQATRRAIEAGFDGVEIHGANTYLLQQFFSPHSNRRTDRWGGDVWQRMTFPLELTDAVKQSVDEYAKTPFIVGYRLSPEEPHTPGITLDDTLKLVGELAEKDLDYLHVSLRAFYQTSIRDDDEIPVIQQIQNNIGGRLPVIGVGEIMTKKDAVHALETAPLLALGREFLIDPDWAVKIQDGKEELIATEMDMEAQEQVVIPEPMWTRIMSVPGWIPQKS